jgi:hypothetical protein
MQRLSGREGKGKEVERTLVRAEVVVARKAAWDPFTILLVTFVQVLRSVLHRQHSKKSKRSRLYRHLCPVL